MSGPVTGEQPPVDSSKRTLTLAVEPDNFDDLDLETEVSEATALLLVLAASSSKFLAALAAGGLTLLLSAPGPPGPPAPGGPAPNDLRLLLASQLVVVV